MKRIRILCYGDSNTWGYISGSEHQRYGDNERWTKLLANLLGNKFEIIEEGLNGRTLTSNDLRPGKEGKNGYSYLMPCLNTHDPIDLVILMLGINELKKDYNKTPEEIGLMLEDYFVKTILNYQSETTGDYPKLVLIAPPIVKESPLFPPDENKYLGAPKKSLKLNEIYYNIAKKYNCYFISNDILDVGIDCIHLTKESHNKLAHELCNMINNIYHDL